MARELIGLILDSGALIAADRSDRVFWAFWKRSVQRNLDVRVTATVLAQAWRGSGNTRMALVLKACGVEALVERAARAAGVLCGRAGTSDIVDFHTVSNLMLEIAGSAPREDCRWGVSNPNMPRVRSAGEAVWPSMKFETVWYFVMRVPRSERKNAEDAGRGSSRSLRWA